MQKNLKHLMLQHAGSHLRRGLETEQQREQEQERQQEVQRKANGGFVNLQLDPTRETWTVDEGSRKEHYEIHERELAYEKSEVCTQ